MFETTDYDLDDILGTSFSPLYSTQNCQKEKKHNAESESEISKKLKLTGTKTDLIRNSDLTPIKNPDYCASYSFKTYSRVVKRKFPGPAGLLPDQPENNKSISELLPDDVRKTDDILLCSQRTSSVFEDAPWEEMTKDFSISNGERLYEKFNIAWIKRNSLLKKLRKVPFLAALIQSLEILNKKNPTVNVTLKDSSGVIQGTILHSLYEDKASFFTVGSVLVLVQFGVLSDENGHCVTITPNNLLSIYYLEVPKTVGNTRTQSSRSTVKKIVVQDYNTEEIWKRYSKDVGDSLKERTVKFGNIYKNSANIVPKIDVNSSKRPAGSDISYNTLQASVSNFILPKTLSVNKYKKAGGFDMFEVPLKPSVSDSDCNLTKKKFIFKQESAFQNKNELNTRTGDNKTVNCTKVTENTDKSQSKLWKNLFEDANIEELFEDF